MLVLTKDIDLTCQSLGDHGCIGKSVALMELRSVLSRVALRFDLAFAEGETGERFDREAKDHFVLELPDLKLIFRERIRCCSN